jgi:hypothetical protein
MALPVPRPQLLFVIVAFVAMALATAMISSTQLRYIPSTRGRRRRRGRHSPAAATVAASATPRSEENIVIVGAGVAGLATAVALRRLGVGAAVLEQGDALRAGGTSLTLFKNGWRVLDAIGVADELRSKYLRIQGCVALPLVTVGTSGCSVAFMDRCVF